MAVELINAITDVIKHVIATNYIQYDDIKLNLLIYTLMSFIISYSLNIFINYDSFKFQIKYLKWYFNYTIYKQENIVYLCNKKNTPFSPFGDYKNNDNDNNNDNKTSESILTRNNSNSLHNDAHLFNYELSYENTSIFHILLSMKLSSKRTSSSSHIISETIYNFNPIHNDETKTNDTLSSKPFLIKSKSINNYFKSFDKEYKIIAYINGHYIILNKDCFDDKDNSVLLKSTSLNSLDIFMSLLQKDFNDNKQYFDSNTKLKIVEYDGKHSIREIGYVKSNLTFTNYVSKHKPFILEKLNLFKNGLLYKNNPYFENNLGFMLHGYYGTGKSYFISAVANYTQRSIYTINLTKIKTINEWRSIMTPVNLEKYIFSIDEIDYLLEDFISQSKTDSHTNETQLKIQSISIRINATQNEQEKNLLIKEMKLLMEMASNDKLTYPFLLCELSGLVSVSNRVLICSTNFPDKIPEALKRPGRFDIILELSKFNHNEIRELLIKLYNPSKEDLQFINKTKFPDNTYTPAQLIMKSSENKNIKDLINKLIHI